MNLKDSFQEIQNEIFFGQEELNLFDLRTLENRINTKLKSLENVLERSDHQRISQEFLANGPLDHLFLDPDISEIIVNSYNEVFFERSGKIHSHQDTFMSEKTFQYFVDRLVLQTGAQFNLQHPYLSGTYKDFRVQLIASPIASHTSLCFRRIKSSRWNLQTMMENGWCDTVGLEWIKLLMRSKSNIIIVGPTGCGKTTTMNSMLAEIPNQERCLIIEDTDELLRPNLCSVKLLTREDPTEQVRNIPMSQLVKLSLRMRPDRLIIGEVRGEEAKDLLLALSTGHAGSIGTLHASSAQQALLRLEMLVQMGAPDWSTDLIRKLIFLGIQEVVTLGRTQNGKRYLKSIDKVSSLEPNQILLENLYSMCD